MTPEQQALLKRLVGPDAWDYYSNLDTRLSLDALLLDAGGNVRAVAAQVLEYTADQLDLTAAGEGPVLTSMTIVGEYSESYAAHQTTTQTRAGQWRARASGLRREATRAPRLPSLSVNPWRGS